ncbi:ion channel protein [Christiangramia fulva]|uniref:Ion channel protein n=1 Tax=Christiangramia fulva TaxID=2126553 RepID=A0A2R3Z316_9FLAO|nr:tetratricopeptide repeat protein [Christiangramia fulva]AVR44670.1 ion channel protein [Christiangramia fulva]
MKKLLLIGVLLMSFLGFSQNEQLFDQANKAYQNGNYEKAVEDYQKILDNGEASAELYYNLANAHYKLNHVAPSIYYYEKALQLKPGDEDIRNNIEFARNMAIDDIEAVEQTGMSDRFNSFLATFTYHTWAWIAIGFSLLFVILFLFYYFSGRPVAKRILFGSAIFSLFLCVVSVFFAFQQRSYIENNEFAIVFSEEAEVRNEPNMRGDASFELHEGARAKVLEDYQEWSRIELANGDQGWIKSSDIKKL